MVIGGASPRRTVLRVKVARSASRVRKLCTGRSSSVRRVLALAGGQDLAHNHLGHVARLDGAALERGADRDLAQIVRRHARERAVEAADRRAHGTGNDDLGHPFSPDDRVEVAPGPHRPGQALRCAVVARYISARPASSHDSFCIAAERPAPDPPTVEGLAQS